MTAGNGQPFEFPRAVKRDEEIIRYTTSTSENKKKITFPDAGPQYVSVIDVHHNPLAVQRIFVHGAERKLARTTG